VGGNSREIRERRSDGHREVFKTARCDTDVFSKNGRPLFRRHEHKMDPELAGVGDDSVSVRGLRVLYPIRNRAEHRHDVPFAINGGNDNGIRAHIARDAVTHFQRAPGTRRQPDACPPAKNWLTQWANHVGRRFR
jgi:hypothetical protein